MRRPLPPLQDIERLLIVKTSSLGDIIHALPVVQAIREARPGLRLGWVARRRFAAVLEGNPHMGRLFVVENKPSLGDLARLRRDMQSERFECALDMQGLLLSGLITRLSGAPVRLGWDRNREGNALFLTHPIVPGRESTAGGNRHEVDLLYGFAEALGVNVPHRDCTPQPYLAESGLAQAEQWLAGLPRPRIVLNVGTARPEKRWPVELWAALAQALARAGRSLVFVGDAGDAQTVAEIKAQLPQRGPVRDLSGQTDLRQLAAVLAACDLMVSADTGPMHIAVAVGTPVVALFGATNPARHGPYGARNIVLNKQPAGSPQARSHAPSAFDYMRAITPEEVLAAIETKLAAPE